MSRNLADANPSDAGPDVAGPAFVWAPEYEVDIGIHVFPTVKYRLVKDRLLEEGTLRPLGLHRPSPASRGELERAHDDAWLDRILERGLSPAEERLLELPFSPALRTASLLCCGGTILAARLALDGEGIGVHLGGGFHHAFRGHGEGFCPLNDVAVAVEAVRAPDEEGPAVARAAVVDLDVHHGNGTAAIFRDEPGVFTFSMHQERNYPLVKPPGDLDVGLPDRIGDDEYLELLSRHLPQVVDDFDPGIVFYLAGVDPYREDQLGGLGLSLEGLRARDRMVLEACRRREIPVAVVLAGGYAHRRDDTVEAHCNTVREAAALL